MTAAILCLFANFVGYVFAPSGSVTLAGQPVTKLTRAIDGATVILRPSSEAMFVASKTGARYKLIGPYKGICLGSGIKDLQGKAKRQGDIAGSGRGSGSVASAGLVVRSGDDMAKFSALSPIGTVRTTGFTISWAGSFTVDTFIVRVTKQDADEESWTQSVPAGADAPKEAFPDIAGARWWNCVVNNVHLESLATYRVAITAVRDGQPVSDAYVDVQTCGSETELLVRTALNQSSDHRLNAEFLESQGLRSEAAKEYLLAGDEDSIQRGRTILNQGRVQS